MKANGAHRTKTTGTENVGSVRIEKKQERAKSNPGFVRASTPKEDRCPIGTGGGQRAELELRLADPALGNLHANHQELSRLEARARDLDRVTPEIAERHRALSSARLELAKQDPRNTVVARARSRTLPKGTRLYSCASTAAIRSILQHGILSDPPGGNNFGAPEMGTGLYVDTVGGTYRDGVKKVLVLEVVGDIQGVSTEPLEEYRRKGELPQEEIERGYRELQNAHPFLMHEGLPPADTELVFRRTDQRIRVVGVVEDAGWDISVPQDRDITPIDEYLRNQQIRLHDSWKPRIYKVARGREASMVCRAEVGATALANVLLPSPLVPRAELAAVEGKAGTSQPYVAHRPLMEHDERGFVTRDFDPAQLTQKQVDQLFAHMLVDWVLSNHDDHPLQFGIAENGDLIAFDKAQSYKFFRAARTASPLAARGVGPEARGAKSPFELEKDPSVSAYARLFAAMQEGKVRPNLESEIVSEALFRMATLKREDVERCLGAYAQEAFPGREQEFFQDVLDRAHAVLDWMID